MALVVVCFIAYACKKNNDNKNQAANQKTETATASGNILSLDATFTKNTGSPISKDSALKWMAAYGSKMASLTSYSSLTKNCVLNSKDLMNILKNPDCVGISFYHGLDSMNRWVVMPFGVTASGSLIKAISIPTPYGYITMDQARKMKNAYAVISSSSIQAQYLGYNTFDRLINKGKAEWIAIQNGLKINGEALILSNANDTAGITYEDESRPCPPFCLQGSLF